MVAGLRVLATGVLAIVVLGTGQARAQSVERDERDTLRVCADANLLPYSNRQGQGYENRLARMLGDHLGIPVAYQWWPQTMGFVRNTLNKRTCDVVLSINAENEMVLNTNPYYRSVYTLVYRSDLGIEIDSLDHPIAGDLRYGVVEKTPAVSLLRAHGYTKLRPYQLTTDTRSRKPAQQAVIDVAKGVVDAAIVWGPIAGYEAAQLDTPLTVVPLVNETVGTQLSFAITMGVRRGQLAWKHQLNDFIRANRGTIRQLLAGYHIPLVDDDGRLIEVSQ
ncbi:quinoprotein dehydrogenase-associated putative ABC transporter substrate-binding protein [Rhodovibrio sodomensis]|uniref:quinoprotein dehydrogenase-associated putative ABC transporter substrate-binding protein n=1 Tax=Rhodovibrio sodomensis TaxID=1088 RepID=UPI001904FB45